MRAIIFLFTFAIATENQFFMQNETLTRKASKAPRHHQNETKKKHSDLCSADYYDVD